MTFTQQGREVFKYTGYANFEKNYQERLEADKKKREQKENQERPFYEKAWEWIGEHEKQLMVISGILGILITLLISL